jgi:uncharacterized protein YlxP (DUF503 family)
MFVGVCRVHLFLPENDSLKGKRAVVKSLLERTRARFNVAAAEVGMLDEHERAELAFVVVSNQAKHANAMLSKISEFCEEHAEAEIGGIHVEMVAMGKPVGDPMVPREDWGLPESWQSEESSRRGKPE